MAKKADKKTVLDNEIRTAGIILLILGAIHIIFSTYLSIGWGVILLIAGTVSLFYRKVGMLLVFGVGLILVGLMNLSSLAYDVSVFWGILAIFQIYWGITVIVRYNRLEKLMKTKSKLTGGQKFLIVMGIIALVIVIFYIVIFLEGIFSITESSSDLFNQSELQIGMFGGDYSYEEERIEEMLMEEGYEVLSSFIMNYSSNAPFFEWYDIEDNTICAPGETYCESNKVLVSVEMKSLGTRSEQVWDFLIISSVIYSDAFTYNLDILSPTDTCKYVFFGHVTRAWFENNNVEAFGLINTYIETATCS